MSINRERVWLIIIVIILVAVGGFIVGEHKAANTSVGSTGKTPAAVKSVHYEIKPYTGVGSGVLAHGTLLDLTGKEQYTEPSDIVGHIEAPGTWVMVRTNE